MNKKELKILEDFQAFIRFGIREDRDLFWILSNLGHDIRGIVREEECFLPRTNGYAKFEKETEGRKSADSGRHAFL